MSPSKTLVIGEAPSRWMDERRITDPLPLAGRDLAQLAGVLWPNEWFERFEPLNVLQFWPGKSESGKGDAWPMAEARLRADSMLRKLTGRRVVFLGRRVEAAFQIQPAAWFKWRKEERLQMSWHDPSSNIFHEVRFEVACCPHPSKVNRWWNERQNVLDAMRFWRELGGVE